MSDEWAADHEKHYKDTQADLDTARDLIEVLERERDYHKDRDHLNRRLVWSARERAEKAEARVAELEQAVRDRFGPQAELILPTQETEDWDDGPLPPMKLGKPVHDWEDDPKPTQETDPG